MAKSKSGGTRSYIRGRVGADVYSIGRDAKGAKQQVVRSLAETVANPQTVSQMRGRMIMSTVMQAVSALRPIIDHSFDNVPAGQPSISEFISRNYALIKADVDAHPSANNDFDLVTYRQKGMQIGKYVVSVGEASIPSGIAFGNAHSGASINIGEGGTYGALKAQWGMTSEEYLTLYTFELADADNPLAGLVLLTARLHIKDNIDDATVVTAENAANAFDIEGNIAPAFTLADGALTIKIANNAESVFYGYQWHIVTRKVNGSLIHSTSVIDAGGNNEYTADQILPTYPVGTEMFLNGGDL